MTTAVVGAGALFSAFVLWFGFRPVRDWRVRQWAVAAELQLTDGNVARVRHHLERHSRATAVGYLLGIAAALALVRHTGVGPVATPLVVVLLLAGASAAAGLASIDRRAPRFGGVARLEPRELDRYRQPVAVWAPRALTLAVLAGGAWSLAVDAVPPGTPGRGPVVAAIAAGVAVLLLGDVAERAALRRPGATGPLDVVVCEDAARAQVVHALAGAVFAVLVALLVPAYARVAATGFGPAEAIVLYAPAFCPIGIVGISWGAAPPSDRPAPAPRRSTRGRPVVIVTVDSASPVPPFEQLRQQVAALIQTGVLTPGTRLPSIRQLAKDLGIATGTVARTYAELEREGLVVARGRHGTVVAATATTPAAAERERRRLLDAAAASFAVEARRLGVGSSDAQAAVRAALDP